MSTEDFDDEETSFIWAHFKFKSIRILDNAITSHFSKLKCEVITSDDATENDIKVVLDKVNFWFDTIVGSSIMFDRDNEFAVDVLFTEEGMPRTSNIPVIMPAIPSDDVLVRIIHSKLNALGGDKVAFGMIEITSDSNFTVTFTGYGEDELPSMEDWIGESSFHDKPWWARNDGSTIDVVPEEGADLTNPPDLGVDLSFIDTRYSPPEDVAIIVRPKFSPEIINGGKTE